MVGLHLEMVVLVRGLQPPQPDYIELELFQLPFLGAQLAHNLLLDSCLLVLALLQGILDQRTQLLLGRSDALQSLSVKALTIIRLPGLGGSLAHLRV